MKRIKNIVLGTLITAGVAVPLGFAFSRHIDADIDLQKNIVVISAEKNENGERTYPMDPVWNKAVELFKRDHPAEAAKYNIVVKHGDESSFEELATLGVTAQSMPDAWFFASNRLPFLLNNAAINKLTQADKDRMFAKAPGASNATRSFESYSGNDYAARFKMETVFFFMNKEKLKTIYHDNASSMAAILNAKQVGAKVLITLNGGAELDISSMSIDDMFKHIEADSTTLPASVNFKKAHDNVAKYFSDNLDLTKVASEMRSSTSKRDLLPFNGANKWWANSFVYATGTPKDNGLIYEKNGQVLSQLAKLDQEGPSRDVMHTYFDLSVSGPKDKLANNGVKKSFQKGLTAFTISGTWDNDRFIESFREVWKDKPNTDEYIDDNLFAIGLPYATDTKGTHHQLKHYIQGKSFGINSRNRPGGEKYNATLDLISEMFTEDIHRLYTREVESFVPANYHGPQLNSEKSFITSVLDIINADQDKRTVKLSDVSELYDSEKYNFGQLWEDITHPLAADLSGNVGINNFDTWVAGTKKLLKQNGIEGGH